MKFSEVEPLRGDAAASLLGVKLNDGVLEVFGGDAGFALELALEAAGKVAGEVEVVSEVVVVASGLKLGAACACFVLSSGLANVNGLPALAGSVSGTFGAAVNRLLALAGAASGASGAANDKVGNAGLMLGGAGGEVMAGKVLTGGRLLGDSSPPSSTNGPAGFAGWLNKELGALCFGWPKGEAVGFGFV